MIKGMAHIAINTSDLDRSVKFYHETLGLPIAEEVKLPNGTRLVHLAAAPGTTVELAGRPEPMGPLPQGRNIGLAHLALTVGDLEDVYRRLTAQGIAFSVQPRPGVGSMKRIAFINDPDGVPIELVEM